MGAHALSQATTAKDIQILCVCCMGNTLCFHDGKEDTNVFVWIKNNEKNGKFQAKLEHYSR